jgi:hypothetical protein
MKRIGVLLIAGAALLGATSLSSAAGVEIGVGPGGAYVGVGPRHHHDWRRDYDYVDRCRTIERRHWSDFRHEWVVTRERICD